MDSARSGRLLRAAIAGAAVVLTAVGLRHFEPVPWAQFALFVFAVLASDLLSVDLPQGGEVSAAVGTAATVALLFPPGTALAIVLVAGFGTLVVRLYTHERPLAGMLLAERILALAVTAPILRLGKPTGLNVGSVDLLSAEGVAASSFVAAFCLLYAFLDQIQIAASQGAGVRAALLSLRTFLGPMYLALGALGLLAAVVYPSLGVWSLALITGLLLVVRQSFNLYTSVRTNYRETLRALAEAIEAQDPATRGHSERTADLAVQLGRELGIHGRDLEVLSYAALLHDIGKLAMPEDSLDSLMDALPASGDTERFHAERGAEILGQVEYLRPTAELVRYHHHPNDESSRRHRLVPLGARIIAVASRFDKLVHPEHSQEALDLRQALKRVRRDAAELFDPRVVRALEAVVEGGRMGA